MTVPMQERRVLGGRDLRARKGDKPGLTGYAAKYNVVSSDLGGFREIIRPGAFATALAETPDVFMLRNHQNDAVLARTKSGSLRLEEDAIGLKFDADLPDTQQAKDLLTLIERGDIDSMSFGFSVIRDDWRYEGPKVVRELIQIELYEISPVTWPAYPETAVAVRSRYEEFVKTKTALDSSTLIARLEIVETEMGVRAHAKTRA